MYKILIVNEHIEVSERKETNISYTNSNSLEMILKKEEYDLIYLKNDIMSERVKKAILCDYMILPNILNKLSLNPQIYTTFINIQILNKLIMDNIKIIEFSNYYEEVLVANIIKQQIIKPDKIKQIYKELSLNEKEIIMAKKTVNSVVLKNYIGGNFLRKCKYVLKKNKIQEMFFNKIIKNINNDILNMEYPTCKI